MFASRGLILMLFSIFALVAQVFAADINTSHRFVISIKHPQGLGGEGKVKIHKEFRAGLGPALIQNIATIAPGFTATLSSINIVNIEKEPVVASKSAANDLLQQTAHAVFQFLNQQAAQAAQAAPATPTTITATRTRITRVQQTIRPTKKLGSPGARPTGKAKSPAVRPNSPAGKAKSPSRHHARDDSEELDFEPFYECEEFEGHCVDSEVVGTFN